MPKSAYFADLIADIVEAKTLWIGFHNGDPTRAGTAGTEVTTTAFAGRLAMGEVRTGDNFANGGLVDFGGVQEAVDVTHYTAWDAQVGGNLMGYNAFGAPMEWEEGQLVSFPANTLTITI